MLTLASIEDINKSCLEQFRTHWQCLENNNQQLWQCRPAEWKLNKCVYDNLVRHHNRRWSSQGPGDQVEARTDVGCLTEPRKGHPRPAQAIDPGAPKTETDLRPQMDSTVGEAVCARAAL